MAQKEAVNTFTGGMIMDTHPLTTPNNVLTNCLNGTLVTFNGNEMILQNDMGNAIIKSNKNGDLVKLPDGFVPVGTTELGGIIYVSSFNPETKECQIGCFPSPERNIEPDRTKDPASFNVTLLINQNGTLILGVYPLIKGAIRLDLTTEELHAGDYYTINLGQGDSISSDIQYEFKLIAVSDDGDVMNLNFSEFGLKYYYTAPNPGKLALLISPKKLTSFSCTYTDLVRTGEYQSTDNSGEYVEVDSISEYKGEHVIVYDYNYYKLIILDDTITITDENNEQQIVHCKEFQLSEYDSDLTYDIIDSSLYNNLFIVKYSNEEYIYTDGIFKSYSSLFKNKTLVVLNNPCFKTENDYYELSGQTFLQVESLNYNENDYLEITYSNDYYLTYNKSNYIFNSETELFLSFNTDNLTVINLINAQFKVKQSGTKYEWHPGNWNATLVCKWNDLNKEENKSVQLSKILIDDVYEITESNSNSKQIVVSSPDPDNHTIKLKVYPVISLDSENEGYIEELVLTVILDTTLSAGQIKLTMWKYYYDNNTINLQYGFAGLLDGKKEITKITISALEYKQYSYNDPDHNELILIESKDKDSYFGSYYDQLEIGKQLLQNKLYAVTIKIETNYCDPIYEYRWLYTNNVFNNKFNTAILDFNEEKLVLPDLKCNIKIQGDNEYPYEITNLDSKFNPIGGDTKESINGGDYTSYGFTKNILDDDIPFEFTYDTGNELFILKEKGNVQSNITEIKTNGIDTPYNYTDNEDLVLNSYPGQRVESGIGVPIWSSAYRYQYYTDYVEIDDYDTENLHFKGRIYNKIKGKVGKVEIQGKPIYTPLVYNSNTALKYNLEFRNNKIVPIYYLCVECFPSIAVRRHGTWLRSECHTWIYGRLSEFNVRLTPYEDKNIIRLRYDQSYSYINTNMSAELLTSDDINTGIYINLNSTNSQGQTLHKIAIKDLSDLGITRSGIIPIIFTKLNGTLRNVQYDRGGSDDWMDSSGDTLSAINLYLNNNDEGRLAISRNGNDTRAMEFDNAFYHSTIGLINSHKDLFILTDNYTKLNVSNFDVLSNKIFNLLTQVYTKTGKNDDYEYYCLNVYDYQLDYKAKVKISGKINTKIKSHLIVSEYQDNYNNENIDNYSSKWNLNNLMIEETDGTIYDFNCYKLFEVSLILVDDYENQVYGNVKKELEGKDEGSVVSCFKNNEGPISITPPLDDTAIYYFVGNNYILTPVDNEHPIKLHYQVIPDTIVKNSDGSFVAEYAALNNELNYNFITYNRETYLLEYNDTDTYTPYITINNEVNGGSSDLPDDRYLQGHSATIINTLNKGL